MQRNVITLTPLNNAPKSITLDLLDTPQGIIARAHGARVRLARKLGVSPLAIAVEVSRG